MPRFRRPAAPDIQLLEEAAKKSLEARTRLQFDWWCDDHDREWYFGALDGKLEWIHGRSHVEDDPAPLRTAAARQGHAKVAVLSDREDVAKALSDTKFYTNIPYAELGGASFMLAIDPGPGYQGVDWHAEQRRVATGALRFGPEALEQAAQVAVRQAALLSLGAPTFDLAEFAEQAALRYFGLVFGYAGADHALLEDAARRGYRALQYLIVGRHFVSEPGTLPAAQQALARLATRTSALLDEYATLLYAGRTPYRPQADRPNATWPTGVQPWDELGLTDLGHPVLRSLPDAAGKLSAQDLCNLVGGLLVGTVGNVQTSVCLVLQSLLQVDAAVDCLREGGLARIRAALPGLLAQHPPVPYLPRRTSEEVEAKGGKIPPGTDCILVLRPGDHAGCPWGQVPDGRAIHPCLGRAFIEPLIEAVLHQVLQLPDLEQCLDTLDGEVLAPQRLWGMGCLRYPLRHRRDKVRVQQPLIVVMPVKAPIAENAERLRQVIRSGAPRIQWLLHDSGIVHVAWFEFMEQDTQLALRTVYDGDFDAYIHRFALKAGELFDQLFEFIEGGPPRPVAEHPFEFVETIRRYNRAPLGGYFYCAYPRTTVAQVPPHKGRQP